MHKLTLFFIVFSVFAKCVVLINPEPTTGPTNTKIPRYCKWESSIEGGLACAFTQQSVTNISEVPPDSLVSLRIVCPLIDDGPESYIQDQRAIFEPEQLAHMWRLRTLRIYGCRLTRLTISALNGLRDLRNLTIKAGAFAYGDSKQHFELERGVFDSSSLLEKVDLSANDIMQLPNHVFCPLGNLASLNLSRNQLEDLAELDFGQQPEGQQRKPRRLDPQVHTTSGLSCSLELRELDVSRNRFSKLPARVFSSLRRLSELNLAGNDIAVVESEAFLGLKSLRSLDLSDNRIVALPADLFREAANSLKELKLQNNSISVLAPGLIANMNQLVALDLSKNLLTSSWMNSATFSGLIRLVLLDLSFNHIDKLDPALFKDLYTLQILNLKYNEIENIAADTFSPMSNLHTLEMSHNRLRYIGGQSLSGLFALSLLAINFNLLEGLNPDAFKNCSSIQDVQLSGNNLDAVPNALKDMGVLKMLDLGENRIESLQRSNFEGMTGLYGLRLMNNFIGNITRDVLAELPALQILNLARNRIEHVDGEAFRGNPMLQAIRLDSNLLQDVSRSFVNVSSLLWLNVSDNMIEHFNYSYLPTQLQWMDIHKNAMVDLGVARPGMRLQTLDASFNRLTKVSRDEIPESIELLFLNDNQIHTVEPQTFLEKPNLTRVDLYANQIVRMDLSALQISPVPEEKLLPEFYIGGNPFVCDCTTEWLQRINQIGLRQHPKVMDLESVYCRLPYDRRRSFVPLLDAKPSQFLCVYTGHCYALCTCCDFDACDCEMLCPANCTCYHDQIWTANVVDCSNANYKQLPVRVPIDATEIYLDGNDLGELNSNVFIGRKNLEILYANDSNIVTIRNSTFTGLKKLVIMHLENNQISELTAIDFAPLESLKELYLQNNHLTHVDNNTFESLRHLEILRLDNNRLSNFALWHLAQNPYLVDMSFSSNPWHCGCIFIERVREWMLTNKEKISDWKRVTCGLGMPLLAPVNGSLVNCASLSGVSSGIHGQSFELYLPLLLVGGILFSLIGALLCGVVRHRRRLGLWAASRCGLRACYKTAAFEDREKPFDAYISYSAVDEAFVSRVLVPGLESTYRLCLHYRDLGAGANVADAVAEAADSSRRTILVLSRNFLHGEWSRFEFKVALRDALRGRGRNVILLLVGGVCPRDLDAELRRRISSHTVLVWGDKLFWQKLRFAMPEVPPMLERPPPLPTPPPPPQHLWA
ncbi:hypothetical protein QAD02_019144 [Eretmocerus hayati]|uniref:Uncharacterized protein n=1 Tax=Eretmocerus hayati TaxID=131215 RepID=A0ACC2PLV2_9HYME|nr:hypothetical protein QAD02_019144 [Eretmocerus hayati]